MKIHNLSVQVIILISFMTANLQLSAADHAYLDPHLEALRPLLGKTWKGEFKNSRPENPVVDIARWERALNGRAVRILHSVNDGAYGGESIVTWDTKEQSVVYHYFTTAGFMTKGTMTFSGSKVITHEVVRGGEEGIKEVRGTTEIRSDGSFRVRTEYLKEGKWVPGRDVTYLEAPAAKVEFR
jgi:hypothetical protein